MNTRFVYEVTIHTCTKIFSFACGVKYICWYTNCTRFLKTNSFQAQIAEYGLIYGHTYINTYVHTCIRGRIQEFLKGVSTSDAREAHKKNFLVPLKSTRTPLTGTPFCIPCAPLSALIESITIQLSHLLSVVFFLH